MLRVWRNSITGDRDLAKKTKHHPGVTKKKPRAVSHPKPKDPTLKTKNTLERSIPKDATLKKSLRRNTLEKCTNVNQSIENYPQKYSISTAEKEFPVQKELLL